MFCTKCGKEIVDGAAFCQYCGTAAAGSGADNGQGGGKKSHQTHARFYIAGAAGVLLAALIGGFFLLRGILGGNGAKVEDENGQDREPLYGAEAAGDALGNPLAGMAVDIPQEEYPVQINVYDASKVRTEEDGGLNRELLPGAEVLLRAGTGVRTGEALKTLAADEAGEIRTELPAGTYTAQINVPGYASSYVTVEVAEKETEVESYVLPTPEEGQTGIVLSWEGEADLDLTLFTPYQSTDGDMAHIGGNTAGDSYGNRLVADNAADCEVMYVNTSEPGSYKLYVNNYTESEAENYSSDQLGGLNVHVYIYDNTGLLEEFSFPVGESGVVWEVADLNGGRVTPAQRVYRNLAGKKWWTQSKWVLDLEENANLRKLMEGMVVAAWGSNDYEPYGYSRGAVNSMQAWVDKLYQGNWENMGDWLADGAPIVFYSPYNDYNYDGGQNMPYILSPSEVEKILERSGHQGDFESVAIVTKEMLEDWAYAASGKKWKLRDMKDVINMYPSWNEFSTEQIGDDYILIFEGAAGMADTVELDNITAQYEGAEYWSVTAECFYKNLLGSGGISHHMANATFHVKRNPDSCFDGYSITGMDLTPIDNMDWVQAYYDYLTEGKLKEDFLIEGSTDRYLDRITLCYVDEDNIPELYAHTNYLEYALYTYYGGQVIELIRGGGLGISDMKWLEMENRIRQQGHSVVYEDHTKIYEIVKGELHQIGEGLLSYEDVAEKEGRPLATWNDTEVSKDEYYILRKQAFDEEGSDYDKYSLDINLSDGWASTVEDALIDELHWTIEDLNR